MKITSKPGLNNMAYLLGFFVADGNMPQDLQLISFSQKDPQVLDAIKRELGSGYLASFVGDSVNLVYISGRKTLKQFYNWIYKDKFLFLNRKFEAYPDKNIDIVTLKNATLMNLQ
jgi:hypothetical protein